MLFGRTLIQISAALSILLKDVSSGAGTEVPSLRVLTDKVTRLWCLYALIHIHTLRASDVSSVARFADATVGAQTVDTLTIPAQVPHHTALINISSISGVPRSQRTHLLVLGRPWQGTELTVVTPSSAPITATL